MSDLLTKGYVSAPVDQAAVAADWAVRGYSCGLFVDPPGQEWNDFVHGVNELVMVAQGRLEMSVGDQSFIAEEGDEIFIPKGAVHSLKNISSGITKWLYGYD
ncbi:MAG: cupin domain-containing protein [Alphaproteobacteria bacterium]|nr:cupin domain-containing protein [Alphaproteobacteria bacterium]MBT4965245.1 cupin domain-containing protein [Alphaproteobacteria bacterium]MBT5162002.1 cupin domain-containing protein [Alphaproteobacteria bacterium]MBT5918622.1 cupin domain-containing protein [Alphaproteobacteria bacterium]MBT6387825.1 cupin domain-containing protein [Alphaproteobacteria bacterium]